MTSDLLWGTYDGLVLVYWRLQVCPCPTEKWMREPGLLWLATISAHDNHAGPMGSRHCAPSCKCSHLINADRQLPTWKKKPRSFNTPKQGWWTSLHLTSSLSIFSPPFLLDLSLIDSKWIGGTKLKCIPGRSCLHPTCLHRKQMAAQARLFPWRSASHNLRNPVN